MFACLGVYQTSLKSERRRGGGGGWVKGSSNFCREGEEEEDPLKEKLAAESSLYPNSLQ